MNIPAWALIVIALAVIAAVVLIVRGLTRAASDTNNPYPPVPEPEDLVPGTFGYRVWPTADGGWSAEIVDEGGEPVFARALDHFGNGRFFTEDAATRAAIREANRMNRQEAAEAARQAAPVVRAEATA